MTGPPLSAGAFFSARGRIEDAAARDFQRALRRRMRRQLQEAGRPPSGGGQVWLKAALLFAWFLASWALLLFWVSTALSAILLSVSLGLAMAGIAFNVPHEAGHGGFSRSRWLNRAMAAGLDLLGGSSYLWRFKHGLHHSQPNVVGVDDDIDLGGLARLAPDQPMRSLYRFQHVYLWCLYALLAVKWQWFDDYAVVLKGRIGGYRLRRPRGRELVIFVGGKFMFLIWSLLIPALFHPPLTVVVFHGIAMLTLGLVLSLVFQVAHCTADAWPEDGVALERPWVVHQVEATVDFAPDSPLLHWYLGGLNFQIEHHLFPGLSHVHYPSLAPLVKETCRQFGIRYAVRPTMIDALKAHYSWLKSMGRRPRTSEVGGQTRRLSRGSPARAWRQCGPVS